MLKTTKKSGKSSYVFQQDGAPAHLANSVQQWMAENMKFWPEDFWPPQSLDLNPLDVSIWLHVESKTFKVRRPNVDTLKASVTKHWKNMKKEYVVNVCQSFHCRLKSRLRVAKFINELLCAHKNIFQKQSNMYNVILVNHEFVTVYVCASRSQDFSNSRYSIYIDDDTFSNSPRFLMRVHK